MKKNLLVTLGCSFTEGVGCYNPNHFHNNKFHWDMDEEEAKIHTQHFHKCSWPNSVGRQLGFDNVLNLGFGGSANSEHVKKFISRVVGKYKDFNIYVIWLMTEPVRISFYDGGGIVSTLPNGTYNRNLMEGYLKDVQDVELGSLNEQVFYIKVMEQVCQNNDYKLILESWANTKKNLLKIYNSNYILHQGDNIFKRANIEALDNREFRSHCLHLNENGNQILANKFVEDIKLNKPEFIVGPISTKVKWMWDGNPRPPKLL